MSSGNSSDLYSTGRRSAVIPNAGYSSSVHPQQQISYRSPLAGLVTDMDAQIRRPDFVGKRSLMEFEQQQSFFPQNQGLGVYLRSVKARPNWERTSPVSTLSTIDLSTISPDASSISNSMNSRFGIPIIQQNRMQTMGVSNRNVNVFDGIPLPNLAQGKMLGNLEVNASSKNSARESEVSIMNHRLQELEKQLLDDEEDADGISAVTNSEWPETIQNLIGSSGKPVSPTPTSSSSSCSSTSASPPLPCSKQALIDVAAAISDGKTETAMEMLTHVRQLGNAKGACEQKLAAYMISALQSRVNPKEHPPAAATELCRDEHAMSTQLLYDASPCFKLGFMAANLAILEATTEQGFNRIHVLDFDIGRGGQYAHLLHALATKKKKLENKPSPSLKITAFVESAGADEKKLHIIGDELKALAAKIGVPFYFEARNFNLADLCSERFKVQPGESLAVNFTFKLYKLPDESVTTENPRDELLRRVRSLSPAVITVVEQDINTNTAPLTARVRDIFEYYTALLDSLDASVARDGDNRSRIEATIGRKLSNAVACDGRDRVERCEVFGKWGARMRMAGFQASPMSQRAAESLRSKLNSVTRGGTGFTMKEESGGICFGWMGRTLTAASAWR